MREAVPMEGVNKAQRARPLQQPVLGSVLEDVHRREALGMVRLESSDSLKGLGVQDLSSQARRSSLYRSSAANALTPSPSRTVELCPRVTVQTDQLVPGGLGKAPTGGYTGRVPHW